MEYWSDGIMGRMFVLFFVILYCIPQSAIEEGASLCYGS